VERRGQLGLTVLRFAVRPRVMRMICEIKLRRDCSNREREREVHCSISPSVVNLSEYDDEKRERER